ncbi:MAG: calcium-binding protein, partial [Phenylobacterium sp.]
MAAFDFETITPAQAANFTAAADSLSFDSGGASGAMVTVAYLPASGATPEQVAVSLAGQTVVFGVGLEGETGISFPNGSLLFIGGPGGETTGGTGAADGLFGGLGDDVLVGGSGGDLLQGNQGADALAGGDGNDVVYGGRDSDTIDVGSGSNFGQGNLGADTISAAAATGPNTLLGGQGDDMILGSGSADFLNGNLANDQIAGGGGADILRGEDGADTLEGGFGADTLDGGAGPDLFVFSPGSSDATLQGADRIEGWSIEDVIDVPGAGGFASLYMVPLTFDYDGGGGYGGYGGMGGMGGGMGQTVIPITFDSALPQANAWMRIYPEYIVTAQVEDGVAVFVDTNGDRFADLAFVLAGAKA